MSLADVNFSISGNTDATGTFDSGQKQVSPSKWAALKFVGSTQGNARWTVLVAGSPRSFSDGDRVDDAFFIQAGQQVEVKVTGAQANVPVTGNFVGLSGDTLEEIAPFIMLLPDTITQLIAAPQTLLGTLQAPAGGSAGPTTFLVPAGTQSIGIMAYIGPFPALDSPAGVTILGNNTQNQYTSMSGGNINGSLANNGPQWIPFSPNSDTAVVCSISAEAAHGAKVDFLASPLALAIDVFQLNGAELTTNDGPAPPAWQAAQASWALGVGAVAGGASVTLVGPTSAGIRIFAFEANLHVKAAAGSFGDLEVSGTVLRNMDFGVADAYVFQFSGQPLSAGSPQTFSLKNTSGVASAAINGGGSYTLG